MSWNEVIKIPMLKSGKVTIAGEKIRSVIFTTPFLDNNYAVILTPFSENAGEFYVHDLTESGFSVTANIGVTFFWIATPITETA